MDNSGNSEIINIDELAENEKITELEEEQSPSLKVNYEKVKQIRERLFEKFTEPEDREVLEQLGFIWSDVDKEKRKGISIDEALKLQNK